MARINMRQANVPTFQDVPLGMFNAVLDALSAYNLTIEEISLFERKLSLVELPAGSYLLATGEVCQTVNFLLQGSCIHAMELPDEKENILNLYTPGDWMMDYTSFTSQQPSRAFIRAYTDAKIARITIHAVHDLIQQSPSFFKVGRLLEKIQYTDVATLHLTPDEKYLHLLTNRPALLQAFPLKIIASYLRLTPETLSRIRSRIS